MADVKELAEQLVNLTIKEANELAKVRERRIRYQTCCKRLLQLQVGPVVVMPVLLKSKLSLM